MGDYGVSGSDFPKFIRFSLAALMFYAPLAAWFLLGIAGVLGDISQERFDHYSVMIAMGCTALFLIVGIPVVLPRAWNGSVPERKLLSRGTRARGFIRSMAEAASGTVGEVDAVRMLLQIEIQEDDGRYLTLPGEFDVPAETAPLLHEGMELPLRVDPGDRYRFAVDWKRLAENPLE
ncbi:MAG: hypothetical protein AVO35_01395 [Candidatus Aegiribacteria sp. MLS_C]|nr:MAG: hypothetical protein AVO35_01395 [Candidatus Aegiribacteria sp. MLS_C]